MLSALLDIEVGLGELLTALLVVGLGYLALQWWRAKQVATSGVSGVSSPQIGVAPIKKTAGNGSASSGAVAPSANLPMSIFFGSQSGTSETFANELAEEAKAYGFKANVVDLADYDAELQLNEEKFAVFLLSTFGEGDPTDNAAEFYAWITQRATEQLPGVTYAVFALGNRQYEHFCNIGRKVDQRLAELGANRLLEHGEGDDDGSLEDDFSSWKSAFWARTKTTFGLAEGVGDEAQVFKPSFALEQKSPEFKYTAGLTPAICDPKHKPILATVVENRQLRSDVPDGAQTNAEGDSTRHIELDVSALRLSYVTADNLGVCPRNDDEAIAAIAARLGVDLRMVFSLRPMGKRKVPVHSPCSVGDALAWYLDFQTLPRASLLSTLAQYTADESEKAQLASWTGAGKEEFLRDELSLLEVLTALPGVRVPWLDFLELCPKIQPRFYTISSSSLVQPKQVALTVALSTHHKPRGRVYRGLATSFLCGLQKGQQACVFVRPSTFRLPKAKRVFAAASPSPPPAGAASSPSSTATLPPVVMVGPGTGVAPFRAFVQEFGYLAARSLPTFPSTHLFFGCRHRSADFIYQQELEAAVQAGSLSKLHAAFSRDSEQKVYVQSHLKENAEQVWQLLSAQRGVLFVCGGTVMGRQVKECIASIAVQHGSLTPQAANEWVKKMHTEGRYIQELWS